MGSNIEFHFCVPIIHHSGLLIPSNQEKFKIPSLSIVTLFHIYLSKKKNPRTISHIKSNKYRKAILTSSNVSKDLLHRTFQPHWNTIPREIPYFVSIIFLQKAFSSITYSHNLFPRSLIEKPKNLNLQASILNRCTDSIPFNYVDI